VLALIVTGVAAAGCTPAHKSSSNTRSALGPPPVTTGATAPTSTTLPAPPTLPTGSSAAIHYQSSAEVLAITQLASAPTTYEGSVVRFAASIANFVRDKSGIARGMNVVDPDTRAASSVVYIQLSPYVAAQSLHVGDLVIIWGDAQGIITDKNAYGGTIVEPAVTETYLLDRTTGYMDDSNPSPS